MQSVVIDSGRIDLVNLETITPLLFEQCLIIALAKDWIEQFSSIPQFDVSIDKKGKLCIISTEALRR
jgi:hypothetical protein